MELTGVPSSDLDLMIRLDRLYNSYLEQGNPESIKQKIDDIKKLIEVLNSLVEKGNTVIVIEHNLDVIKTADWIIFFRKSEPLSCFGN